MIGELGNQPLRLAAHADQRQSEIVDPPQEAVELRAIDDVAPEFGIPVDDGEMHPVERAGESWAKLADDDDPVGVTVQQVDGGTDSPPAQADRRESP